METVVLFTSMLGNGKRRRNERICVSRGFQIIDEIALKVTANFHDVCVPGNWKNPWYFGSRGTLLKRAAAKVSSENSRY